MALSKEDFHDVKNAYGKALAKKVKKVTNDAEDSSGSASTRFGIRTKAKRIQADLKSGNYVKLKPLSGPAAYDKELETGNKKTTHFAPSHQHNGYGWKDGYKHKGLGSS